MPNDDDDQQTNDEESAPEDAFALVGNEIRAEILRAFGDARVQERSTPVLSFSELHDRTDVDVLSSQFNYHLQQLVGHFVEKIEGSPESDGPETRGAASHGVSESDDSVTRESTPHGGYRIRPEGRLLYQTLRAGTFDRRPEPTSVDAGFDCYYCRAAVEATFDGGEARIQCPDCEYLYDVAAAPPGAFEDETGVLSRVSGYNHHEHLAFARDVCPTCANAVDTEFLPPDEPSFPGAERHEVYVYRSCDHCGDQRYLSVGEALLADHGLVSFCHERGVDVLSTPLWELEFAATDRHVTVRSTDPWEVALRVTYDGDTLELVVDEELTVVERNRR